MMFMHIGLAALTTVLAAPAAATNGAATTTRAAAAARVHGAGVRVAQATTRRGNQMRPNHQKRAKIRQRIRALRAWRLTEALDLDEKSAIRLFPVLNRYDAQLLKLARQGHTLRRELRRQLKAPTPDNRRLNRLIGQMTKHKRNGFRLRNARFADLRKVLTPAQAAKLMIVLPEIDRRIARKIRRAMRKGPKARRGRPGRRGPNGRRPGRRPGRRGEFKNPFRGPPPAPR